MRGLVYVKGGVQVTSTAHVNWKRLPWGAVSSVRLGVVAYPPITRYGAENPNFRNPKAKITAVLRARRAGI